MRYAQSRAEVARLTKQNEQLHTDLGTMVELKLQLAEATAALKEVVEAKEFGTDESVASRYMAAMPPQ